MVAGVLQVNFQLPGVPYGGGTVFKITGCVVAKRSHDARKAADKPDNLPGPPNIRTQLGSSPESTLSCALSMNAFNP